MSVQTSASGTSVTGVSNTNGAASSSESSVSGIVIGSGIAVWDESVLEATFSESISNRITFPEVVGRLIKNNVERYRVDLIAGIDTHYHVNGINFHSFKFHLSNSVSVPLTLDVNKIKDTISEIQQKKINYIEFLKKIMEAGCSHYDAYLTGKRVVYTGKTGDSHTEWFPGAK